MEQPINARIDRVDGNVGISGDGAIFLSGATAFDFQLRSEVGVPLHGLTAREPSAFAVVGATGAIRISVDLGATWIEPDSPNVQDDLFAVQFACDNDIGLAVGAAGRILRGTSEGATWMAVDSTTQRTLRDVAIIDGLQGVAVAVGDAGTIVRTENGGATWTTALSGTNEDLASVDFRSTCDPDKDIGRFAGFAVGARGTILFSVDNGISWQSIDLGIQADLRHARINFPELPVTDRIQCEFIDDSDRLWAWTEGSPQPSLLGEFGESILWYTDMINTISWSTGIAGSEGSLYWYRSPKGCSDD